LHERCSLCSASPLGRRSSDGYFTISRGSLTLALSQRERERWEWGLAA
jgi:hypothetical protein